MAKWKAPEDAGPGVSVGGQFFPILDGFVITPSGDYASALEPFGYVQVDDSDEGAPPVIEEPAPVPEAPAPEPEVAPAEPVTPAEPETPPAAAPDAPAAEPAPSTEG